MNRVPGGRLELRPRPKDNLGPLALLTFVAAFALFAAVAGRAWASGAWAVVLTALMVLVFGVYPWVYLATSAIWVDSREVGIRRLLISRRVPREDVRRVVGALGRILFVGPGGRVLITSARFWTDDQLKAVAAELGLKLEGGARSLGPL